MSRVVVLGGTGAMGARVADGLEAAGHEVVRAARATGVDVSTGAGLDAALEGADVVVDCLNRPTLSKGAAVGFFEAAARRVVAAAERAGVSHLVVLSIVNVTDAAVRRSMGYYAGKAAQEDAYAASSLPVTVVRTTAWFTLAETFLSQIRVGPLALVPRMRLRPVHPDAAASLLVQAVTRGPGTALVELAGPEEVDAASMARAVAAARHQGVRVLGFPVPVRGLREGLLPGPGATVDDRRFEDWLRGGAR
jgi:uncharacterized protein YbjT (DUF2867 family)